MALLADRRIALGVCPTSNLELGVYAAIVLHPIDRLRRAGVVVSLNTDDPMLLGASLFMTFPKAHWTQIYSTNPLERLNAEIKRRTRVVGIFPNDASITRLVGAMMLEQNDEWSLNRRYMQLEGLQTLSDTVPTRLSAVAR